MKKRIVTLMSVCLLTVAGAQARSFDYEHSHEVSLSYGYMSSSNWIDAMSNFAGGVLGERIDNDKFFGPLAVEYMYRVKPWLGVGAIASYGRLKQEVFRGSATERCREGEASNSYVTLLPAVKFDWLRLKHFGLYSKVGLGATFRKEKVTYDDPQYADRDGSEFHFNWQLSAIGVEAGSPVIRAFTEFGFGEQGIALAGVRVKF